MGKVSKIPYVDASWSPWIGCTKVSEACRNCYAEAWAKRSGRDFSTLVRASNAKFYEPQKWKGNKRIFVCELSDFLHPDVDMEWYANAVEVMRSSWRHTFLILTKRPERWDSFLEFWPDIADKAWLGVTVENQQQAEKRIPVLLEAPAALHFVSIEPMLGPVTLEYLEAPKRQRGFVDWVIVGAESGPIRRECKVEWIESTVDEAHCEDVPVFVKQGSHRFPGRQGDIPDHLWQIKEVPR